MNLVLALSASNSSSAAQSEATLMSISREVGCSTDSSNTLRAQLSTIQESISKTHDAVVMQGTAVNSVLQSMAVGLNRQLYATDEPYSMQDIVGSGDTKHATLPNNSASGSCATFGLSLSPKPITLLESSQNFYPESYTTDSLVPLSCLVFNKAWEQLEGVDFKINVYRLIYLSSFRHWYWLTISIQIHRSSRYWAVTKSTPQDKCREPKGLEWRHTVVLPYSLLKKMQTFLCQVERLNDNSSLCLSLSDRDTIEWRPQISSVDALSTSPQLSSASLGVLNYLHDLGCERYDESQVVQIEIIDPPCYFCSSLNGTLVFEIKFVDTTPASELIYAIRALHCMNGTPGFSRLVGVVTDDNRRYLKSYLVELPRQCRNILTIADPSLSWERRERWAVQLIRGISLVHTRGFVFGGLTTKTRPIIDEKDSVKFWSFKERFLPGCKIGAYYPPEFRYVRDMSPLVKEADFPCVTTKTDIFHLGMLLWLLAENKPETHASPVCRRMQCNTRGKKDGTCDSSHAEPVALPLLPESIPKYFRDIVDACRREDPSKRPAAREILQMFPCSNISQLGISGSNKADIRMIAEGMKINRIACNICDRRPLPLPIFHCNVCELGDFDLCQVCYKGGTHCDDDSHFLVEIGMIGSWIVPQKYHSCVKSSGTRDIIDLSCQ
ncbi:MAG: hypothetical protein Q9167_004561 [Letrouitia subvulpina]